MKKKGVEQAKQIILELLYKTPIIESACQKAEISRMTFYRWKEDDKEFAKDVEEAIQGGRLLVNDLAENQLIGAVKDRNFQAIAYWLKHHHPSYTTRIKIEGVLNTIHELSPEREKLMRKAFALAGMKFEEYFPEIEDKNIKQQTNE